ncbi:unnamed protein product [Phytomonas sp. EM1]|nr:unnamed protein product [Phytomonas sp. EM1]|eukprot:CCW63652.1 unnamed protein product [Phytomonas sp. isolate EM1]
MYFGNETPFHLKPIPNRGLRKHEADAFFHYPGYKHPLSSEALKEECNPFYISEEHRLHPLLTPEDEIRHSARVQQEKRDKIIEIRRQRQLFESKKLQEKRENEFQQQQERAAQLVGRSIRNYGSDFRDTITHHCQTVDSKKQCDYDEAMMKHRYHLRQQKIDRATNSRFNILSWEPRKEVYVPPKPVLDE